MTDPYISLDDLGDYMGVDELPLNVAQLAIDSAMQTVRRYIGQQITYVEDDVEFHNGKGGFKLRLRERPVRHVSEVLVDGVALDPAAYALNKSILALTDGGFFSVGVQNIEVTYSHGWDVLDWDSSGPDTSGPVDEDDLEDPVPADLRLATLSIARRRVDSSGEQDDTLTGESIGNYSYTRDTAQAGTDDLLPAESAVLDAYTVRLTV